MGVSRMGFLLTCLASACVLVPLNPKAFAAPVPRSTPDPTVDSASLNTTASTDHVATNKTLTEEESDSHLHEDILLLVVFVLIIVILIIWGVATGAIFDENERVNRRKSRSARQQPSSRRTSSPRRRPRRSSRRIVSRSRPYSNIKPEDKETFPLDHPLWSHLASKREEWLAIKEAAKKEREGGNEKVCISAPQPLV